MTKTDDGTRDLTREYEVLSELAIRFTAWLEIVVRRAKIDYLRNQKKFKAELPVEVVIDKCKQDAHLFKNEDGFDFENEQLAIAFSKLTPARSQLLIMLFVQSLTPQEAADSLRCSVQHIYNLRSLALKDLKQILCNGSK